MSSPYFIVPTTHGNIKGKLTKTKNQFPYYAFYKVPFAKPPLGELRFALPQQPEPWKNTLDCSKLVVSTSLQGLVMKPDSKFLAGSEDCLHLNVFSPQMPDIESSQPQPSLPVLVFIHGGAFCIGSSDPRLYGPELFIHHGFVYVSINYRLGPLGFFSLQDDLAPGNQGMHDQVMALRWIKNNIVAFGGDPNNVTIMGESAGAMSCFLHLVSPLSKGLFHKIIALSGSATTPFMHYDREPILYAKTFAKHLGAKDDMTVPELVTFLQGIPAKKLLHNTTLFRDWELVTPMPWNPVVDAYASTPFLPLPFEEAVGLGHFNKDITILAGFNSDEGLIFTAKYPRIPKQWRLLFQDWDKWAPQVFFNRETDLITPEDVQAVRKIRQRFFPESMSSNNEEVRIPAMSDQNLKILTDVFSTAVFHAPLIHDLDLLLDQGATIFTYNFSYVGTMALLDIFRLTPFQLMLSFTARSFGCKIYEKDFGCCHGDDLLYIFPFAVLGFPKALVTESDKQVSKCFVDRLSHMVKTGSPNSSDDQVIWKRYERSESPNQFFQFCTDTKCIELDQDVQERVAFWNQVVDEVGLLRRELSDKPVPELHRYPATKRYP